LEHVEYCCKGSALVPYWQAETVACTCVSGTVEGNQKFLKLPVKVHNRRQNWGLVVYCRNQWVVLSAEKLVFFASKETRNVISKIRIMLLKFINCEVILHQEFVPTDQMINQYYYLPEGPDMSTPSVESGLVDSP
jgi:hypothetical protein